MLLLLVDVTVLEIPVPFSFDPISVPVAVSRSSQRGPTRVVCCAGCVEEVFPSSTAIEQFASISRLPTTEASDRVLPPIPVC